MNPERISQAYREWMQLLEYHPNTVTSNYLQIKHFLTHLKENQITSLQHITPIHIQEWYTLEQHRVSKTTGNLLRNSTLNHHQTNLRTFSHYLYYTEQGTLEVNLKNETPQEYERVILTPQEITLLYTAAANSNQPLHDKILLHLYYGCGLRRNEGIQLNTHDILTDRKMLYVSKGKGYTDRYIPLINSYITDFEKYLQLIPEASKAHPKESPFLRSPTGKRLHIEHPNRRLKKLIQDTDNHTLIQKKATLHSLRHSIATHLLHNGMDIEHIAKLLGHQYLDTTQIYTHLQTHAHHRQ